MLHTAQCTMLTIVGSCALYALLKPNALYALKNQYAIHIPVLQLNLVYRVLKCKSEFSWISSVPGNARILLA